MENYFSEHNYNERTIKKEEYISEEDKEEFYKLMEEYNKLMEEYNKLGKEYNKLVEEFRIRREKIIDRTRKIIDKYSIEDKNGELS